MKLTLLVGVVVDLRLLLRLLFDPKAIDKAWNMTTNIMIYIAEEWGRIALKFDKILLPD